MIALLAPRMFAVRRGLGLRRPRLAGRLAADERGDGTTAALVLERVPRAMREVVGG
jgi:hypothetical protein